MPSSAFFSLHQVYCTHILILALYFFFFFFAHYSFYFIFKKIFFFSFFFLNFRYHFMGGSRSLLSCRCVIVFYLGFPKCLTENIVLYNMCDLMSNLHSFTPGKHLWSILHKATKRIHIPVIKSFGVPECAYPLPAESISILNQHKGLLSGMVLSFLISSPS